MAIHHEKAIMKISAKPAQETGAMSPPPT